MCKTIEVTSLRPRRGEWLVTRCWKVRQNQNIVGKGGGIQDPRTTQVRTGWVLWRKATLCALPVSKPGEYRGVDQILQRLLLSL